MAEQMTFQQRFSAWLADYPDDAILRMVFRGVVVVTMAVLALDLAGMNGLLKPSDIASPPTEITPRLDVPAILAPLLPGTDRRGVPMPHADGTLGKPMSFELVGGGRLMASGTITPGVSKAFAAEIAKRADYVKTVVLNSPGGSVSDALIMGRLIRDKKLATEIEAGKLCASSCPLMFFGGQERHVGDKAAIGVHQVFAASAPDPNAQRDEMSDAQRISARCQRYLGDMGINLQVWVHAMETPKDRLYMFKPDELKTLNVVTSTSAAGPTEAPATKART